MTSKLLERPLRGKCFQNFKRFMRASGRMGCEKERYNPCKINIPLIKKLVN